MYATFIGGNGPEFPGRVVTDPAGNVFLTGNTSSTNFPLVAPVQGAYGGGATDARVMQLNPAGTSITFSTYLGGFGGDDIGWAVLPDSAGNAYVAIKTDSANLPVAGAFQATKNGGADS